VVVPPVPVVPPVAVVPPVFMTVAPPVPPVAGSLLLLQATMTEEPSRTCAISATVRSGVLKVVFVFIEIPRFE
jgi:hypothetical protein